MISTMKELKIISPSMTRLSFFIFDHIYDCHSLWTVVLVVHGFTKGRHKERYLCFALCPWLSLSLLNFCSYIILSSQPWFPSWVLWCSVSLENSAFQRKHSSSWKAQGLLTSCMLFFRDKSFLVLHLNLTHPRKETIKGWKILFILLELVLVTLAAS